MAGPDVRTRRWTRIEYDRLIEAGFFRPGDPVELLGGQMIVAEPQGSRHFAALRATQEALRAAFGDGWEIRGQGPIALDEESEPEPDLATSWSVSSDGTVWTFELRPDITFHDGTLFDANAVVFSFERQLRADHPAHEPDFVWSLIRAGLEAALAQHSVADLCREAAERGIPRAALDPASYEI